MDIKTVIIALVAVVAVAGIGFYVANSADDTAQVPEVDTSLPIFGNANNDDTIDDADIDEIKKIIETGWVQEDFPLADANNDKTVDEKDIQHVRDMMDRKEMTIYFIDAAKQCVSIEVPFEKYMVTGYEAMYGVQVLDKHMNAVGRDDMKKTSTVRDEIINETIYKNAAPIGPAYFMLNMGLITELQQKTGVKVLITNEGYADSYADKLSKLGITIINTAFMDQEKYKTSTLTLGYIMDAEMKAHQYVSFMEKFETEYNEKMDSLTTEQKSVKGLFNTFGNVLYASGENGADDAKKLEAAGAVNALTTDMTNGMPMKNIVKGDPWHLGGEYNVRFMVVQAGFNYGSTIENYAATWDKGVEGSSWDKMMVDHYTDGIIVINMLFHPVLFQSYIAEFMHPEVFDDGYTDKKHQYLVDNFLPDLSKKDYKVADHPFCVTYDDVKDYLKYKPGVKALA